MFGNSNPTSRGSTYNGGKNLMGCSCPCLRSKECDNKFRNIFIGCADYHDYVLVSYLKKQLDYVKRKDIVWDTCTYMSDSRKAHAKEDRYFIYNQKPTCSLISLTGYI